MRDWRLRSPPLALLAQALNNLEHLLASAMAVNQLIGHAHADLFASVGTKQALDEQVAHEDAHKHAAIATVLLLGGVVEVEVAEWAAENLGHFVGSEAALCVVCAAEGVVVEGDAVDGADEQ